MDALLTFVIPVGNYHEAIAERAIASVVAQTVPCACVVVYDREHRGAGWARNRGLGETKTPFVAFLDADDWIEPHYAERCLQVYDGARYVFTDWIGWQETADGLAEDRKNAADIPWRGDGGWHVITALLPTDAVKALGGFDAGIQGEDTDFYWKLTRNGVCGKRLAEPLFHYGKEGQRAKAWIQHPDHDRLMRDILARYKGLPMACGDCGDDLPDNTLPVNEQAPGDVLVQTLWGGNRQVRGVITGRLYPRSGNGKRLWIAAQDAAAMAQFFKRVVEMPAPVKPRQLEGMKAFARTIGDVLTAQTNAPARVEMPAGVTPKPDAGRVLRLYREGAADYIPTDFFP